MAFWVLLIFKICNISIRGFATWYLNDIECQVSSQGEYQTRMADVPSSTPTECNILLLDFVFFTSKAFDANIAHFVYFVKTPIATVENYWYSILTPVFPENPHAWLFLNLVILVTFNLGLKYCRRASQYHMTDVCRPGGFNLETTISVLHF